MSSHPARHRLRAALAILPVLAAMPATAADIDFAPTANFQYDLVRFDADDARLRDDDAFRRTRLGFKVKSARWQFVAEHDFAERSPADAYLEFTPAKGHALRLGQFKQPFLLEDAISDKHLPFLEQAPLGTFGISRRIGVEYARQAGWGTVNAAAFGQRLDGTLDSPGIATRATWLLRQREGEVLHVGGGFASESPDTEQASFSANPGSALTAVRVGSTGTLRRVERIDRGALEALWIRGAGSLQAEAARVSVQRDGLRSFDGDAHSVLATWSPTGHARSYRRGVPGAPAANGAWELAARWSAIDLDDSGVAGGRVRQLAASAIYIPNAHLRLGAYLVRSRRDGGIDEPVLAALRIQLTY